MRTQEMLQTHPKKSFMEISELTTCIISIVECAEACTSCADACLGEDKVQMLTKCIRLNLDCADICQATARVLSRQTDPSAALIRAQLEACAVACRICAQECDRHALQHDHCRICAVACRRCEEACNRMVSILPQRTEISH